MFWIHGDRVHGESIDLGSGSYLDYQLMIL